MKITGRKMFVFILLSLLGFIVTAGYIFLMYRLKNVIEVKAVIFFLGYEVIASLGVLSLNALEKQTEGLAKMIKAWRGNE